MDGRPAKKQKVESSSLKICLVGAGRMGKVRAPLIYANRYLILTAIVDVDKRAGMELASEFGATYHSSIESAAAGCDSCAVWISTPTFTHKAAITAACSQRNVSSIFCEKPVGKDAGEIKELFNMCRASGTKLCCGFQRRFDPSYLDLKRRVTKGEIGKVTMGNVFFADHPCPSLEFLKSGGDPFLDLAPHDIDFLRWVLDDDVVELYATGSSSHSELKKCGVIDNATMLCKFARGCVITIMMSRSATYGYDQRVELFGTKGSISVENQTRTSTVVKDGFGIRNDCLKYSFPERFNEAFVAEVDAFVKTVRFGEVWPISEDDCVFTQVVAENAGISYNLGKKVTLTKRPTKSTTRLVVRQIGIGDFGSFMDKLLRSHSDGSKYFQLPPYSRSKSPHLHWTRDVLENVSTDAFYICSPDSLHQTHGMQCLMAGKHVLIEKPVTPDFDSVMQAALAMSAKMQRQLVVMVGFHRRFDTQFLKAKEYLRANAVDTVCISSFDPVPPEPNLEFVVQNSMCHDVDLLYFLWPDATTILLTNAHINDASASAITLSGKIVLGENAKGDVSFTIQYKKQHPSYVQKVAFAKDGRGSAEFGYDFVAEEGEPFCNVYREAYTRQWEEFVELCNKSSSGQSVEDANVVRMQGYARSFTLMKTAASMVKELLK